MNPNILLLFIVISIMIYLNATIVMASALISAGIAFSFTYPSLVSLYAEDKGSFNFILILVSFIESILLFGFLVSFILLRA